MATRIDQAGILLFASVLFAASSSMASDGVIEINQAKAIAGGVNGNTVSDPPDFPVVITQPGSYKLTGNLVVPNENTHAIQVLTDDVSIDLAGFEIRGPVSCTGVPLTCSHPLGLGAGVSAPPGSASGTSVRNGSIRGMGGNGLDLGEQAEVTNVRVRSNGNAGIRAETGSIVSGNTALRNRFYGLAIGIGSIISGNTAYANGAGGITASFGSIVSGNVASYNEGDGIDAGYAVTVLGNSVLRNRDYGLQLSSSSGYGQNLITDNALGTVTGSGSVNLGNNGCNGAPTCP